MRSPKPVVTWRRPLTIYVRKACLTLPNVRGARLRRESSGHTSILAARSVYSWKSIVKATSWLGPEEFQTLVKDLSMHVAASNPLYLRREDVPEDVIVREKNIYEVQAREGGKPERIVERIVQGKLEKFFEEICLLEQPFVKDPDMSVNQLVSGVVAKLGENIVVRRFQRYQLGGQ